MGTRKRRKEKTALLWIRDISKTPEEGSQVLMPGSMHFVGIGLNFPFYFAFKEYFQVSIRCLNVQGQQIKSVCWILFSNGVCLLN